MAALLSRIHFEPRRFRPTSLVAAALALLLGTVTLSQSPTSSTMIPATYFGIHLHHPSVVTWPTVPVGSWRFWDAHAAWPDMEVHRGQWDFSYIDRYMNLADQNHAEILFALGLTPRWASSRPDEKSVYQPGWAAPPSNIEDWSNYVRTIATHCKGRIHAYEIWNEPNYKVFWSGSTDELLTLTKEASAIIKGIDPTAIIVSPAATNNASGPPWVNEFLGKGGGKYVDVIGYHFYVNAQPPERMIASINQVRRVMADNHVSNKPLWNTETGWLKPSTFASDEIAASYVARSYLLAWSGGVQRFYWYAWDQGPPLQLVDPVTHTVTPAGKAYGVIQNWMVGARMSPCSQDTSGFWSCELIRGQVHQFVVWNPDGTKTFSVPPQWHIRTATPLLDASRPVKANSMDVGQAPVLFDPTASH
jgi:hypothetical protein